MAQSLSRLWTHLIFSTKDRYPFLGDRILRTEIHAYLAAMLRAQNCETLIVGGVADHTHALFALCRTLPIASVVKRLNEHHPVGSRQALRSSPNSIGKAGMPRFP